MVILSIGAHAKADTIAVKMKISVSQDLQARLFSCIGCKLDWILEKLTMLVVGTVCSSNSWVEGTSKPSRTRRIHSLVGQTP